MDIDKIMAYAIINRVCLSKGFPMYILLNKQLFGGRGKNTAMSEIKAMAAHSIRSKTNLTHKQIGHMFKLNDHTASIYFGRLYHDLYMTNKSFRVLADHVLN